MNMENSCQDLSCERAASLLDEGIKPAENAALAAHLARCGECRVMARIMELSASLAAEVPVGMTDSVMRCIRVERTKQAARMRFIRRFGAAAAAAVLVPAAVILAPILFRAEDAAPVTSAEEDVLAADTQPETLAAATAEAYADTTFVPPVLVMTPPPAAVTTAVSEEAKTTTALVPPAGSAPSYVSQDKNQKIPSTYATMAVEDLKTERPLQAVFTALIGAEAASSLKEDDLAAAALLCYEHEITRAEFLEAAAALEVVFTKDQLDAIFG
ncbi:MAG: hypothetical protein E7662_07625 [Ruminococcaceae bacterium]|nr:hypothetical protein [Oscillospiraceae bacterium]